MCLEKSVDVDYEVVVVGGGFAGIRALYLLRQKGFTVRGIERSGGLGGVWYNNTYPGARCDSPQPYYQIHDPSLVDDWTFSERFPCQQEMQAYFRYVDSKWALSKDYDFGTTVTQTSFNDNSTWSISLSDGRCLRTRWFIPAIGFASQPVVPDIKGAQQFEGEVYHTARWPQSEVSLEGKRAAVIGAGASAAQVITAIAPQVKSLRVYQRSPGIVLPQSPESSEYSNPCYTPLTAAGALAAFKGSQETFIGLEFTFHDPASAPVGSLLREIVNTRLYKEGGLGLVFGNFVDTWNDKVANDELYAFWARATREKVHDRDLHEVLAPSTPPYPIGIKRTISVDNYYEVFNQPNVELEDISRAGITEITKTGIKTKSGHHAFDLIIYATGFQSMIQGLTNLNITGRHGLPLKGAWKNGSSSYLGMTVHGFPNMFYMFGPQGPAVRANVPTTVECQAQWLVSTLTELRDKNIYHFEPTATAVQQWKSRLTRSWGKTLYPQFTTWESAGSSATEPLWVKGIPEYKHALNQCRAPDFIGFESLPSTEEDLIKPIGKKGSMEATLLFIITLIAVYTTAGRLP